jgi:hypothetical protein
MSRLIPKELIPHTLWDHESSVLYLPPQLISGWKILLEKNGLLDKATTRAPEGFEGGMSKEDTDNHFAWRFTGSVARVMLSVLDPKQDLHEISDVFTQFFSGNRIFLADLPCGSGAASLSILSVYCELRKQGLIPREPLDVVVVGGEISKFAQCYANEGLTYLLSELEDQAISLEFEIMDWDVCDRFLNTDLIHHLTLRSQGCSAKVLMLANFSGFLQRNNKWKDAQEQIDELFRFNRGQDSIALWIEPQKSDVTKTNGFMPRLIEWFKVKFSAILSTKDVYQQESSVDVKHPLNDGTFKTNLVVVRFDLPLQKHL